MRLRFKLMAALLATGLGSVVLVGGVAYVSVNYKVDSLRKQQAAEHFHTYMTAYLAEYGDWATAIRTESFDRFVRRQEGERPRDGGELPSEMLERMPPRINEQARVRDARPDGGPPPLLREARNGSGAADATRPQPGQSSVPAAAQRGAGEGARGAYGPPPEGQRAPGEAARGGYGPPSEGQRGPGEVARGGYGPPPEGQRRPGEGARDGYGPPPEGQRGPGEGARGGYGPPPEGQRGPGEGARGGYGPPPEGQRGPREGARDGYGPPPEGQRGPGEGARDGYGPPPEGQRGPRDGARDGYGPPPEGQRGPGEGARDGYGPPPGGLRGPREGARDGYRPPSEGQRGPREGARDGYGPPPEGQRGPGEGARGSYGPPPEGQRGPGEGARGGYGPPPDGQRSQGEGPRGAPARDSARPAPQGHSALGGRTDAAQPAAPENPRAASTAPARPEGEPDDHPGERPPPPRRDGPPPFRFVLADADYNVLLGGGQFGRGDVLPEKLRATARPIVVKDKIVAYMSSEGAPKPTAQEQKYIDALYNSLWWGIAAAAGLATLLGVLLSRGLSRSLSGLTKAVKGMHEGELRQQVPVKGKDEVAALATAFNEMSEQLAQSHEELNASHATILQQAEQLRELSIRDALTQLYNRRHFDEQANTLFNQAVRHKRPLALVICDIDHFKKINDTYSHATGDVVLRHVGNILRKHMRLSDLVARYGGEEFVMALPETPGPQAAALCDKLRTLIESFPWHEVHPELKVTMSMGVYADIAVGSAETMLQKADALLYRAKESGRNRVCFA